MLSEYCRETLYRALSSAGRATALQAVGHKFDPYSAHQTVEEL
jgi:hypothetical protein